MCGQLVFLVKVRVCMLTCMTTEARKECGSLAGRVTGYDLSNPGTGRRTEILLTAEPFLWTPVMFSKGRGAGKGRGVGWFLVSLSSQESQETDEVTEAIFTVSTSLKLPWNFRVLAQRAALAGGTAVRALTQHCGLVMVISLTNHSGEHRREELLFQVTERLTYAQKPSLFK